MTRSEESQARHDELVKTLAREYLDKGFVVKADLEGYDRPGMIRGYEPDIVAFKGNQTKIVEVETEDTLKSERDKGQQEAFRQEADENSNTTFKKRVAR